MPSSESAPRARLLDAASRLFYYQGIHVGIQAVCDEARVSKRSLYKWFATKDELVTASLEYSGPRSQRLILPEPEDDRSPRDLILHVFDWLATFTASGEYCGCPFIATAVEVKDRTHPATATARRFKQEMTDFFELQARRLGAADPGLLARQLTLVYDGAATRALMYDGPVDDLVRPTVATLLDAASSG